jgi:hypothetical protein
MFCCLCGASMQRLDEGKHTKKVKKKNKKIRKANLGKQI